MSAPGSCSPPPLCRSNARWWSQKYGHSSHKDAFAVSPDCDGFFRAIRDNRVDQVERFVAENPAAVFTKVFGNKRTALYVASFFGRHQIVRALLHHGADKNLQCDGALPIDVAGFGSTDPVDRMKVHALLQDNGCPQVILRLDDRHAGETRRFRLQIHFSEAVNEFTQEDVKTSEGCQVVAFSMLRRDLYMVSVLLTSADASVEVPAGAARAVGGRCNARSRPFHLHVQ